MNQSEDETSLSDLGQKIDKMKSERKEDAPKTDEASGVAKAMHMATELLAAVGVGGGMGYGLDYWLDTSPIFFVIMFFLGFAAGVRNMLRNTMRNK